MHPYADAPIGAVTQTSPSWAASWGHPPGPSGRDDATPSTWPSSSSGASCVPNGPGFRPSHTGPGCSSFPSSSGSPAASSTCRVSMVAVLSSWPWPAHAVRSISCPFHIRELTRPCGPVTPPKGALSFGFTRFVSFTDATRAMRLLTSTPVGLTPTEHASLTWTQ